MFLFFSLSFPLPVFVPFAEMHSKSSQSGRWKKAGRDPLESRGPSAVREPGHLVALG